MTDSLRRRQLLVGMGTVLAAGAARALPRGDVPAWDMQADVVITGAGAAGVCAAIEARRAGATVLLLEALAQPGGASGLSGGVIYAGGGTALQRALGIEDSPRQMFDYLALSGAPNPPLEKLRLYCDESPAHFDWLAAQGVRYRESLSVVRGLPEDDASLFFSGSERSWPARELTPAVPRGHVPGLPGRLGGHHLMEVLLQRASKLGVQLLRGTAAGQLVLESDGRVSGLAARSGGAAINIGARRGLVLACGGFVHGRDMVRRYAPRLYQCATPWGGAGDLGLGIQMGVAAGGAALRMDEGFVSLDLGVSERALAGVLVNAAGQRFIAEDAFTGAIGHAVAYEQQGRAWLLTDQDSHLAGAQEDFPLAAQSNTIGGIAEQLALPRGALQQTVAYYNRHAGLGEDPAFHKHGNYLRPLQGPPYMAWTVSVERAFCPALTLGGLETTPDGAVLNGLGEAIPGLYAAGRTAAGIATAPLLASGLSLGDATFFGRRAGRAAAVKA